MKNLKTFTIFLFLCGIPTIVISQVTLRISPLGRSYERSYEIRFNGQLRRYSDADSILSKFPIPCNGEIDFIIEETPMDSLLGKNREEGKPIIDKGDFMAEIVTGYAFSIKVQQEVETRNVTQILKYSIIPGGGRFYAKKPWQGIGMAILQLAPIPFAVYYDDQRQKFYDLAVEAAALGDQAGLDENFDKSQYFSRLTEFAIGTSATATLINVFDVLINVKETKFVPLVSNDGLRLRIIKSF